jgi:hypothetical protein
MSDDYYGCEYGTRVRILINFEEDGIRNALANWRLLARNAFHPCVLPLIYSHSRRYLAARSSVAFIKRNTRRSRNGGGSAIGRFIDLDQSGNEKDALANRHPIFGAERSLVPLLAPIDR